MALRGPFHERPVNGRTTQLETLVHSRQMADALLVAGVATGAAAVGAAAAAATSRRRLARIRGQTLTARTSLEAIQRTSTEDRRVRDTILSSMREGVLLVDRDGRCVFANDALVTHLGGSPASLDELFPTEIRNAARRAGYTGAPNTVEVETGVPSRWLQASSQPIDDGGSVLVVVRDVTEARTLDAVRRDFVANASHELKTPAASIRAAAETLLNGALEDPPAAHRFTEQLQRDAMRLSRIVSDLLDLSRLETGSDLAERVRLDVIATDEVERLGDRAEEAGITIQLHADAVPSVAGSGRDLALLVRNLIDNAVRYTPPGGRVDVSVSAVDGQIVLQVVDTGMGIPQRHLPRVFERFYRVDRARSRETGGTGLGLAIVRHVAENHGGGVTVRSELSAGSTFVVRLPVGGAARADAP
jgi:two-component system, OmpR family, phosphate regulon sensor histidine kinase PhoR